MDILQLFHSYMVNTKAIYNDLLKRIVVTHSKIQIITHPIFYPLYNIYTKFATRNFKFGSNIKKFIKYICTFGLEIH